MDTEFGLSQKRMMRWKKIGVYVLLTFLIFGIFATKLERKTNRAEEDYVAAEVSFTKWEHLLGNSEKNFVKLKQLVKKHPELQTHYDPLIAQTLLTTPSPKDATPFIERTLARTHQSYYGDYARTSLKISEKKYQEALNEALKLKEKMEADDRFWEKSQGRCALFAFNLMRIATLSEQLEYKDLEIKTWEEIKYYGGWDTRQSKNELIGQEGFEQLLNHFSVHETTLLDYIKAREAQLKTP